MTDESLGEIAEIMQSNQGVGGGRSLCDEDISDWGCALDDKGPEFWEDYLGGPDDTVIESYYESYAETYEDTEIYEEDDYEEPMSDDGKTFQEHIADGQESGSTVSRTEEIIGWLSESQLAQQFVNKEGFSVTKGPHVRLKDGSILDLLAWLSDEGITGGSEVAGYSIVHSKPRSKYGETLSFFKIIVDVPFAPLSKENNEISFDDDIPF